MHDRTKFSDHVSISKRRTAQVMLETVRIGDKDVPVVHQRNEQNNLISNKMNTLQKLAWRFNNIAFKDSKFYGSGIRLGTERIIVEKYKERHVAGYAQDSVAQLARMGYSVRDIIRKLDLAPKEIHISHRTPEAPLNAMLNEGIDVIWDLVDKTVSAATDYFDASNADIGTGTSNAAVVATQTELQAGAVYVAMDGGYPTSATQKINFKGTFGSSDANQAWEEYSVRNSHATPKNLMRAISSKGTKASGETWTLEIEITGS